MPIQRSVKWFYKSCPKCKKGDIFVDKDMYGYYEECLQCGYHKDLKVIATLPHIGSGGNNDVKAGILEPKKEGE